MDRPKSQAPAHVRRWNVHVPKARRRRPFHTDKIWATARRCTELGGDLDAHRERAHCVEEGNKQSQRPGDEQRCIREWWWRRWKRWRWRRGRLGPGWRKCDQGRAPLCGQGAGCGAREESGQARRCQPSPRGQRGGSGGGGCTNQAPPGQRKAAREQHVCQQPTQRGKGTHGDAHAPSIELKRSEEGRQQRAPK